MRLLLRHRQGHVHSLPLHRQVPFQKPFLKSLKEFLKSLIPANHKGVPIRMSWMMLELPAICREEGCPGA